MQILGISTPNDLTFINSVSVFFLLGSINSLEKFDKK